MNDFERLEADFFDEGLSPGKALTLARRLESDPVAASEFLSLYAVDRLLAVKLGPRKSDAVQVILQQIKREESTFVQDVLRDIRDDLAPGRAAPQSLSVGERLKRLVAFPRWALAGVTALMAALFAVWFWPTIGEPEIATALQTRVFINGSEPAVEVSSSRRLNVGDVLKTEPGGATTIIFGKEATQIELGPSTELGIMSLARGKHFALRTGKLEATVARQRSFRPMVIVTPQAEARVLGTRFSLTVGTNATSLEVSEGKVKFTRASDGKMVKVGAGNHSVAAAHTELSALPATGRILREYWTNLASNVLFPAGSTLDSSRSVDKPDGWDHLERFESKRLPRSTPYVERIRGYVHAPTNGLYRFAITTVHVEAALHLSRNDKPEEVVQVAHRNPIGGDTLNHVTPVPLQAGRKYYIEIVHESDGGDDQLTVMWQAPGRDPEIIPGEFLSPFPIQGKKGQR